MKLVIKARGLELTESLRTYVERRLRFALARVAQVVHRADVTLEDVNGPRGGIDKVCRIRVQGQDVPEVIIEERAAEVEAAVAFSAARVGRAVLRAIDRRRPAFLRAAPGWGR